jgi:hypothetical protein
MTRAMGRLAIILTLALVSTSGIAQADTFTFSPSPANLSNLDHGYYYIWGIGNWQLPAGQQIVSATLTYDDIYDWTYESNDRLATYLLDTPTHDPELNATHQYSWVYSAWDGENGNNHFPGTTALLGTWYDPFGEWTKRTDLVVPIPSDYFAWMTDGSFGFGIDPDCHYYNSGVQFEIVTAATPVPEPASLLLLGAGLIGIGRTLRRRTR